MFAALRGDTIPALKANMKRFLGLLLLISAIAAFLLAVSHIEFANGSSARISGVNSRCRTKTCKLGQLSSVCNTHERRRAGGADRAY